MKKLAIELLFFVMIYNYSSYLFAQGGDFETDDVSPPSEPAETQPMNSASPDEGVPPDAGNSAGGVGDGEKLGEPPSTEMSTPSDEVESSRGAGEDQSAEYGLFGPFRIGPTLAVGFPHPLTVGINLMWKKMFSGEISFGSFTTPEMSGVKVGISNWDIRGRWHPLNSGLFIGGAYGNQTITAEATKKIAVSGTDVDTELKLKVDTAYFTPHVGWFSVWDSGLTLGFEVGYQMALSSKAKDLEVSAGSASQTSAVSSTKEYKDQEKNIKDSAERFGKLSVPYVTLCRVGWMF